MKLTKLQRHTAYILMLYWFENHEYPTIFFCESVNILFGWPFSKKSIKENLPELWSMKPKKLDSDGTWFGCDEDGRFKRIELLNQCIKETA